MADNARVEEIVKLAMLQLNSKEPVIMSLDQADTVALFHFIADLRATRDAQAAQLASLAEKDPEVFRREPKNMSSLPVNTPILDYAQAGTLIDKAMHHLNESLPNGQKRRTETAFAMLEDGCAAMRVWLRQSGYEV